MCYLCYLPQNVSFLSISVILQGEHLISPTWQIQSSDFLVMFPGFLTLVEIWEAWSNSVVITGILFLSLLISSKFGLFRKASKLLMVADVQISFHDSLLPFIL